MFRVRLVKHPITALAISTPVEPWGFDGGTVSLTPASVDTITYN